MNRNKQPEFSNQNGCPLAVRKTAIAARCLEYENLNSFLRDFVNMGGRRKKNVEKKKSC